MRSSKKRQYVLFENANANAEIVRLIEDPKFVGCNTRITWSAEEKLKFQYELKSDKVSANIARATHGKTVESEILKEKDQIVSRFFFVLKNVPLTYVSKNTLSEVQSTLKIWVDGDLWEVTDNLLESGPFDQKYLTSVDDFGYTTVTFGDGVSGMMPSDESIIEAQYRVGTGSVGNVGRNTLTNFELPANSQSIISYIESSTNPLPASGGTDIESIDDAKIAGPKSLIFQQRAVVLEDYEHLVMSKFQDSVSRAKARFVFNGSLNTICVSIARKGGIKVDPSLLNLVRGYLETIKMIGYDVRVEPAKYIPIQIGMTVFLAKGFDSESIRERIRMVLGNEANPDGSMGFFIPITLALETWFMLANSMRH